MDRHKAVPDGNTNTPVLAPGVALRRSERSRSWCVRVGLAPAISLAVASWRNNWRRDGWREGRWRGTGESMMSHRVFSSTSTRLFSWTTLLNTCLRVCVCVCECASQVFPTNFDTDLYLNWMQIYAQEVQYVRRHAHMLPFCMWILFVVWSSRTCHGASA